MYAMFSLHERPRRGFDVEYRLLGRRVPSTLAVEQCWAVIVSPANMSQAAVLMVSIPKAHSRVAGNL